MTLIAAALGNGLAVDTALADGGCGHSPSCASGRARVRGGAGRLVGGAWTGTNGGGRRKGACAVPAPLLAFTENVGVDSMPRGEGGRAPRRVDPVEQPGPTREEGREAGTSLVGGTGHRTAAAAAFESAATCRRVPPIPLSEQIAVAVDAPISPGPPRHVVVDQTAARGRNAPAESDRQRLTRTAAPGTVLALLTATHLPNFVLGRGQ